MQISKPCPFCGSVKIGLVDNVPKWVSWVEDAVECHDCGARGPIPRKDREEAVIQWNTRHDLAPSKTAQSDI